MPWERKAIAAHVVLGFLLVGAVLKAASWVDMTFGYAKGLDKMEIMELRHQRGEELNVFLSAPPKESKHHHRRIRR